MTVQVVLGTKHVMLLGGVNGIRDEKNLGRGLRIRAKNTVIPQILQYVSDISAALGVSLRSAAKGLIQRR